MALLLALDQGTTSSRAILFDDQGAVRGVAQQELTQHFPRPGWVEHDPDEIWASQRAVVERVLATSGVRPADLAGLGITNQRETVVVWDRKTGEPIHRAIVWQDRRTAATCDRLRAAGAEAVVRAKTGLLLDPYFSAAKIAWILDHVEGARARAQAGELAFGTVDAWLVHRLTGGRVHVTDASNASRTSLCDIHRGTWDDELLALFDVPRSVLPEILDSSGVIAEASVAAPGVLIAGIAGDQQAALFGQACFEAGQAKNTYGTGCFLLVNTGTSPVPPARGVLTTVAWRRGDRTEYALEGSVFVGGAAVQWLRDGLGLIERAEDVEALARTVEDSGGVVLVPAFAGLGAPHWDPYARGTMFGITRGTTRGHVARAALEGIAFQVLDLVETLRRHAGLELDELRVDGGAASNALLLQIQADLLDRPVVRPRTTETTAFGAACLAGLATGVWTCEAEIASTWTADARFEPGMAGDVREALRARWDRALERSLGWDC